MLCQDCRVRNAENTIEVILFEYSRQFQCRLRTGSSLEHCEAARFLNGGSESMGAKKNKSEAQNVEQIGGTQNVDLNRS